ncbi:MAG: hypothetical protein IKK52_06915 [Alphaproteobacteria bacterium]|nr:hypothetical protein [Alphaproteobacteria bacterium]
MHKICNIWFLFILAVFLTFPLRQAEAVIPFEISLAETAGKISTWIQEKIILVQAKITSINESKIAKGIGDGLKKIKEVRDCVKEQYSGVETPSQKCQKYVQKYKFLAGAVKMAGNAKRFMGSIKDSKTYKIVQLTRAIADDAIKITQLDEYREDRINRLKNQADIDTDTLNGKIEMAKDDLKIMKEDHKKMAASADLLQKGQMEAEELQMAQYIIQLEAGKIQIKEKLARDIITIDKQFAETTAGIVKRREKNIAEVLELKSKLKEDEDKKNNKKTNKSNSNSNSNQAPSEQTQTPVEIVAAAQQKYSPNIDIADTIAGSEKRIAQINEDIEVSNVAGFNQANVYLSDSVDPANDSSSDLELGETPEGKSETVQTAIDNTLLQIDMVAKIIQMELTTLETETMEKIMQNVNFKIERRYNNDNALVTDVCNYEVKEQENKKSTAEETPAQEASSSDKGTEASNQAEEESDTKKEDKTQINEVIVG